MFKGIRKAAVVTAIVSFALLGSACSAPTAATNYTGKAVVTEHHRSGKSCRGTVQLPDGQQAKIRLGHKRICPSVQDNVPVRIENGAYKGKA